MNCKPGDLAIVIKSGVGNEGRIVKCLRLATDADRVNEGFIGGFGIPLWVVDKPLKCITGGRRHRARLAWDAQLRPIRPGDITDEEVRDLYAPKQPEAA